MILSTVLNALHILCRTHSVAYCYYQCYTLYLIPCALLVGCMVESAHSSIGRGRKAKAREKGKRKEETDPMGDCGWMSLTRDGEAGSCGGCEEEARWDVRDSARGWGDGARVRYSYLWILSTCQMKLYICHVVLQSNVGACCQESGSRNWPGALSRYNYTPTRGTSTARGRDTVGSSRRILPSRNTMVRRANWAISLSCVTITIVSPRSFKS